MKRNIWLAVMGLVCLTACGSKTEEARTAPRPDQAVTVSTFDAGEEIPETEAYRTEAEEKEKGAGQETAAQPEEGAAAEKDAQIEESVQSEEVVRAEEVVQSEEVVRAEETMLIYDIDEGYLTVPYLPWLPHHSYDWSRMKRDGSFLVYEDENYAGSQIGIDVSKFQGEIDWEKVGNMEGLSFVIVRLGHRGYQEGGITLDPFYESNVEGALAAGLSVGVYFFSQAVDVQEAEEEADFVYEHLKEYEIDGPVAFDTEKIKYDHYRTENMSNTEITDCTIAFCKRIREYGYEPMIYANAKWLTTRLELERLTEYKVWYADYEQEPLYPYWFDMWQYSNQGEIDGIDGKVDMNIYFYGQRAR